MGLSLYMSLDFHMKKRCNHFSAKNENKTHFEHVSRLRYTVGPLNTTRDLWKTRKKSQQRRDDLFENM